MSSYSESGSGNGDSSANSTAASTSATASSSSASKSSPSILAAKVLIGSRFFHSSTSSSERYSSGSATEWPLNRYVTASTSCGFASSRAQSTASPTTRCTSSTSMPSQRVPGTPKPAA